MRGFTALLLAVPCLSLPGCDTSRDNCEGRSPTSENTYYISNLRTADGSTPPPGTPCQQLCYLADGFQDAQCRVNNEGTQDATVTCTVNFVCND
jgi:hypothetical protein